ncbi:phage replisome organizer N-terminal domain-containing protein [Enterococcus sp.]|uniref:phage replisome organizer N-terminal domain-containing protein n=1 Tax=Enterococcus sp. TaxID=35783 RepID=UPI00289F9011|nr:phage replisome organizer N-terminal domain-containing protein [Enterococcus sp.]
MEENEEEKKGMLYWLKLEKDFFEHKEIKKLRQIQGGDTYTIIYLKMLLFSLSTEGKLFYDGYGDTFAEDLALSLNEDESDVDATISFLTQYGFVTKLSDDEYYMTAVMGMTGKKTEAAVRKEKSRKAQKQAMCDNVTTMSHNCPSLSDNVTQRREEKDNREDPDAREQIQDSRNEIKNKDIRPEQSLEPDAKSELRDNKNSQIEDNDSLSATEYIKSQITEDDSNSKNMTDICVLVREIADIDNVELIASKVNKLILSTGYSIGDVYRLISQNEDSIKNIMDCPFDRDDAWTMDNIILSISPHKPKEEKTDYIYEDTADEGDGELPF